MAFGQKTKLLDKSFFHDVDFAIASLPACDTTNGLRPNNNSQLIPFLDDRMYT